MEIYIYIYIYIYNHTYNTFVENEREKRKIKKNTLDSPLRSDRGGCGGGSGGSRSSGEIVTTSAMSAMMVGTDQRGQSHGLQRIPQRNLFTPAFKTHTMWHGQITTQI